MIDVQGRLRQALWLRRQVLVEEQPHLCGSLDCRCEGTVVSSKQKASRALNAVWYFGPFQICFHPDNCSKVLHTNPALAAMQTANLRVGQAGRNPMAAK